MLSLIIAQEKIADTVVHTEVHMQYLYQNTKMSVWCVGTYLMC